MSLEAIQQILVKQTPSNIPSTILSLTLNLLPFQTIRPTLQQTFSTYTSLQHLQITHCDLRNLKNFPDLFQLQELRLSHNNLQGSFQNIMKLRQLLYLDISHNKISDINRLLPLRRLKKLEVHLKGNPMEKKEGYKVLNLKVVGEPRPHPVRNSDEKGENNAVADNVEAEKGVKKEDGVKKQEKSNPNSIEFNYLNSLRKFRHLHDVIKIEAEEIELRPPTVSIRKQHEPGTRSRIRGGRGRRGGRGFHADSQRRFRQQSQDLLSLFLRREDQSNWEPGLGIMSDRQILGRRAQIPFDGENIDEDSDMNDEERDRERQRIRNTQRARDIERDYGMFRERQRQREIESMTHWEQQRDKRRERDREREREQERQAQMNRNSVSDISHASKLGDIFNLTHPNPFHRSSSQANPQPSNSPSFDDSSSRNQFNYFLQQPSVDKEPGLKIMGREESNSIVPREEANDRNKEEGNNVQRQREETEKEREERRGKMTLQERQKIQREVEKEKRRFQIRHQKNLSKEIRLSRNEQDLDSDSDGQDEGDIVDIESESSISQNNESLGQQGQELKQMYKEELLRRQQEQEEEENGEDHEEEEEENANQSEELFIELVDNINEESIEEDESDN